MSCLRQGADLWAAAHLLIPGLLLHLVLHLALCPGRRSLEALAEDGAVELIHFLLQLLIFLQAATSAAAR